jgi:diguanylate cyclase (GGDEF)-like protein
MTKHILIADDNRALRQQLEQVLARQNYEVLIAQNSDQLVQIAQEYVPDLVLIDLMKVYSDDYEAIRLLRNDIRTAYLPIIILSTRATPNDIVAGLDAGADDYITKPFNIPELLARIERRLCHAAQQFLRNPLTRLPGAILLAEKLKYRLKQRDLFAFLDVDLDNFTAFNDAYSPTRGDQMIRLLAMVLLEQVQAHGADGAFISHIGSDDFAVITPPDVLDNLCRNIISTFDQQVHRLYHSEDLVCGNPQSTDQQGMPRQFPIISISIGAVTNRCRAFDNHEEISRVAAEMKQFAKQQAGSSYAVYCEIEREASGSRVSIHA